MSDANQLIEKLYEYWRENGMPYHDEAIFEINQEILDYCFNKNKAAKEAAAFRGYSGGWQMEDAIKEHAFSLELAYHIWQILKHETLVYDLGSGPGFYTQFLKQRGMAVAAFDANKHEDLSLVFPIINIDLSTPLEIIGKANAVICLEVGEHIDAEFETIFLDNITGLARNKIILSWAVPGQGGFGHVNCQPNDYIISQIEGRGWCYNEEQSLHLRARCSGCSWFENTIMVFDLKPFR